MAEANAQAKATPLYHWHLAHRAKMVTFSGWNMPLWYPSGGVAEHQIVVTKAGVFDTSHMSVVTIEGPGSFDLLQLCFTRDLNACLNRNRLPLRPSRCVYGAYLNEHGWVIDDAVVYQTGPDSYMTVVNAGMGAVITDHLKSYASGEEVRITDLTGRVGKIDLQGPSSAKIMVKLLRQPETVLEDMVYFSFKGHFDVKQGTAETLLKDGTPILLSRTGYTGEFGFEVFVDLQHLVRAWEMILLTGQDVGLLACGLAARDSLRAGACLPLAHQDIGPWPFINHPWPYALPYNDACTTFTKKFMGDVILSARDRAEHTCAFVGYDPRKVGIGDSAVVLDPQGTDIGAVLTCVSDMAIARCDNRIFSLASPNKPENFKPTGLSCGFIKVKSRLVAGQEVRLRDGRREISVEIANDVRPDRSSRSSMHEMMH